MDGTPFGRYRLVSLLGRGGMGEVWRAHDTETDRVVAIKLLPASLSADKEFQQRFRREAHAAARLNDPHVIPIHHYGEIDGRLYVDMRLIEGRDLETVLTNGPLDPERAVRIIEQVARALNAAHKVGLIHRDIKPSNILLDADDFAYLIDFGIARAVDETRMTKSGNMIGTLLYMAPERLDDREEDARGDVYSLACVLYEALTGHPPFPGNTARQLINAHLRMPPPRPSTSQPNVPEQVDDVIAMGMAKNPDRRYATTIELANAARDAITDPIPRPAPPPPAPVPPGLRPLSPPPAAVTKAPPPTPVAKSATPAAVTKAPQPTPVAKSAPPAAVTKYRQPQPQPQPPTSAWTPPTTGLQAGSFASPVVDFPSTGPSVSPVPSPQPRRQVILIAAIVAAVVLLSVGIIGYFLVGDRHSSESPTAQPEPPSSSRSTTPAPPAGQPSALNGLLLNASQVNAAMGTSGMVSNASITDMLDNSTWVSDQACLPLGFAVQAKVYADSGYTAVHAVALAKPQQSFLEQAVVLFPSAQQASSFFTASTQSWQACSNRQFTISANGNSQVHTVGPVTDENGTLSATITPANSIGVCERALTVANNVAIDVATCAGPSGAAVSIARQIAAKVR